LEPDTEPSASVTDHQFRDLGRSDDGDDWKSALDRNGFHALNVDTEPGENVRDHSFRDLERFDCGDGVAGWRGGLTDGGLKPLDMDTTVHTNVREHSFRNPGDHPRGMIMQEGSTMTPLPLGKCWREGIRDTGLCASACGRV
jgi:hypothetical protein